MAFQPSPGAKSPGKYPVTPGSAYDYYGEQEGAGWYYNPYNDTYSRNPNIIRESQVATGNRKPDKPGLEDSLIPIAATAGTIEATRQVGNVAAGYWTETAAEEAVRIAAEQAAAAEIAGTTQATAATQGAGVATSGASGSAATSTAPGMMGEASGGIAGQSVPTAGGGVMAPEAAVTTTGEAANSGGALAGSEAAFATYGIPVAVALGAASLYDSADKAGESSWHASTAALDSIFPGMGWAARELGDMAGVKTGKHEDQLGRDAIRDILYDRGVMDKDFAITLADGSKFDIGKDGKNDITSAAGNEINPYDVDFTDPNAQQGVEWLNGLGAIMGGGDKKRQSDAVGMLFNAAQSTGNDPASIRANVLKVYQDLGVTPEDAAATLDEMVAAEKISAEEAAIYKQGINKLFDPNSEFSTGLPAAPTAPGLMPPGPASLPPGSPTATEQAGASLEPLPPAPMPEQKPGMMAPQSQPLQITGMPQMSDEERRRIAAMGKPGLMVQTQ